MDAEAIIRGNNNTRGWVFGDDKRRVLDVFYTDYDTKLFVEDGHLIEERIESSGYSSDDDSCLCTLGRTGSTGLQQNKYFDAETCGATRRGRNGVSRKSPPESPPCLTEEEVAELIRPQTISTAKAALAYYNSKHHTKYELVDPINSNGSLWGGGIWYHTNFSAKLPATASNSSQEGYGDSITKLFFAELTVARNKSGSSTKYSVTACRPLDDARRTTRCEMCGDGILHPTGRFRKGLYEFKRRALRPRRNGRVV